LLSKGMGCWVLRSTPGATGRGFFWEPLSPTHHTGTCFKPGQAHEVDTLLPQFETGDGKTQEPGPPLSGAEAKLC
jgi:hypothetical protein